MNTIKLKKKEDRRIRRGHPWVFSNEIAEGLAGTEPGELVRVVDYAGRFVGSGYANPRTLISVRIVTREPEEEVGPGLVRERILAAKALRERLIPGREAYRAFFSESDLLPGLVVDRYGGWLSVQSLTAGVERLLPAITGALADIYAPEGIVLRNDAGPRELEGLPREKKILFGDCRPVTVELYGLKFTVDLLEGQKTGFFLDQVDNYPLLEGISSGAEVLDLFCHTGAWSLAAAKDGARSCLGIDSSQAACELAEGNARDNGYDGVARFAREDAFDALKRLATGGVRFDVVVCDPPAFIKSRARMAEGLKGYRDLNVRAMRVLKPGGWLVTCSCSHHMDRETFLEVLRAGAAGAGRTARLIEFRSQSRDHPVLLAAPETEYLKCALLQVL